MNEKSSHSIAPAELCLLLAAGKPLELIDVRTPPEFTNAHVPGARLIPLNELNVHTYLEQHNLGQPLYVLCQAGARARKAIEQFEKCGCSDCVLVEGGTQAWIDAGLPVTHGVSHVLPIMRQVQIVVGTLSAIGRAGAAHQPLVRRRPALARLRTSLCRPHRHLRNGDPPRENAMEQISVPVSRVSQLR